MAVLNSWQRIDRVLPGKPFGNGIDGDLTISTNTTQSLTVQSCSGTSGSNTLTLASGAFNDGDVVLIHQTRGTGAGQWEINRVVSGGGTTTLTLQFPLTYTFEDSGNSQAQVIKIPMYNNVTINSGVTLTANGWDGDKNGFVVFAAKGKTIIGGTINNKGSDRSYSGMGGNWVYPVIGGGFRGGGSRDQINSFGFQGEGIAGAGGQSPYANGNGGGAGGGNAYYNAGGGGGHATPGNSATGSDSTNGAGGGTAGTPDLTSMVFGGGGGGATGTAGSNHSSGANGGGIVAIFCKDLLVTGAITVNGGNNSLTNYREAGGGGAGGSVLIVCETANLGNGLITAIGGDVYDTENEKGGDGGLGRIAIHHSKTISGSTNPTFSDVLDPTLIEKKGASFLFNLV